MMSWSTYQPGSGAYKFLIANVLACVLSDLVSENSTWMTAETPTPVGANQRSAVTCTARSGPLLPKFASPPSCSGMMVMGVGVGSIVRVWQTGVVGCRIEI